MEKTNRKQSFIFFFLVFLMIASSGKPFIWGFDSVARFNTIHNFFNPSDIQEPIEYKYSSSLAILGSPLYYLGTFSKSGKTGAAYIKHLKSTVAHFNHILLFLFLIWGYGFLKRRFAMSDAQSRISAILLLFASMVLPASRDFYSELLWSVTAIYCFDQLVYCFFPEENSPYHPVKLAVASALMVWFSTALAPIWVFSVVFVYIAFVVTTTKNENFLHSFFGQVFHRGNVYSALGLILGIMFYFLENYIERGDIFASGYWHERFEFEPIRYLYMLFSPGKGLIFFIPALFLVVFYPLTKNLKKQLVPSQISLYTGWYAFTIGLLLLYGCWWAWGGAGYWGPRFFLMPSICSTIMLAHLLLNRHLLASFLKYILYLITILSLFINRTGITIVQRYFGECDISIEQCHLGWTESPFYLFTKNPSEWLLLIDHRSTISLLIGLGAILLVKKWGRAKTSQTIR